MTVLTSATKSGRSTSSTFTSVSRKGKSTSVVQKKYKESYRVMGGFEQRPWTPTKRRGPIAAEHRGPGPQYLLPQLLGTRVVDSKRAAAPAYSFGQRHRPRTESFSPGPLYNITGLGCKGKDTPPAYCLQSRPKEIPKYLTPAPGEYNVEKSDKMLVKSAPRYTFGVKKPPKSTSETPAPGAYEPEKAILALDRKPAYTFGMKTIIAKPSNTPAPGAYEPEKAKLDNTPAYSFGIRPILDRPNNNPAPCQYEPEKAKKLDHSPAYPFGMRINHDKPSNTPAPTAYAVEKVNLDHHPAYSFGQRTKTDSAV